MSALYCTIDNLLAHVPERELIQLTDDKDTGELQEGIALACISDATAIINGYVIGRYKPFLADNVPGLIRKICEEISIYELYKRRLGHRMGKDDPWYIRYRDALAMLKDIQKGILILDAPGAGGEGEDGRGMGDHRVTRTYGRIFTRGVLDQMP